MLKLSMFVCLASIKILDTWLIFVYYKEKFHVLLYCYLPTITMLPTIIFGKKYCRSSQRAQQEIQKQSWNNGAKLNSNIIIKHLNFLQLDYRFSRSDKSFEHVQNHTRFHEFY